MLQPKKVIRRKVMKGRMRGKATRGEKLSFGDFGLKTLEAAWITDRQIDPVLLPRPSDQEHLYPYPYEFQPVSW